MPRLWTLALWVVISLSGLYTLRAALAQEKIDKSFITLRIERDTLDREIGDAEKVVRDLENKQSWLKEEAAAALELGELDKTKKGSSEELGLQKRLRDARTNVGGKESLQDVNKALDQKQTELQQMRRHKETIEAERNQKIDLEKPKQDFKKDISGYFTVLIGLVIIGFFVVAALDEVVRRKIFSGQAGIQFITLFSLVIAIILFGITEVLEGKELAALLGGLSGYILGRSTGTRMAPPQTTISSPQITDISPKTVTLGSTLITVPVQISGTDLQLANSVKITQDTREVPVSNVTSSDRTISCTLTLDPSLPKGMCDVTVTNSDGAVAKLARAFTIESEPVSNPTPQTAAPGKNAALGHHA